jgi:hypothetical protein
VLLVLAAIEQDDFATAYHDLPIDFQEKENSEIIFRTVPDQIHWIVF